MTGKRKRKRKPVPPSKNHWPQSLTRLAEEAAERMDRRPVAPRVGLEKTAEDFRFACPYSDEHREHWTYLLLDAFGTRSSAVMNQFLDTFAKLVPNNHWDAERHNWFPDQDTFDAVVEIVHSLRPENSAQAAHAAQLCALHLSAMKLGERAVKHYGDDRTAAILAKTVRAYGDGLERLARLQGKVKPKTVNQTIQVVYVDQRSVRLNGGVLSDGDQPQGTERGEIVQGAALQRAREDDGL